ncbi:hypothetical protein Bca101_010070 [Brassica carinata]
MANPYSRKKYLSRCSYSRQRPISLGQHLNTSDLFIGLFLCRKQKQSMIQSILKDLLVGLFDSLHEKMTEAGGNRKSEIFPHSEACSALTPTCLT